MYELYLIKSRIFYIKYCLIGFTVLLALTGLSLVIIGSTINEVFVEFSYFLENKYFAPAVLLYSIGFAVFGISVIGLIGALKENSFLITTYGILLGIIFTFQISAGISTNILMYDGIYDQLQRKLTSVMTQYDYSDEFRYHVDILQTGVGCCGINGPGDWNSDILRDTHPFSCCGKIDINGKCKFIYERGCYPVLKYIIGDVSTILAISAYVLAVMQLAGMCFSLYLGKALKTQKVVKEYRRWKLTNELFNTGDNETYPIDKK